MIGWKRCLDNCIAELELVGTWSNEQRKDVRDVMHAKHRTDRVRVRSIVHEPTGQPRLEARPAYYRPQSGTVVYRVGETVEVADVNRDVDVVCASGIHYFRSREAAVVYDQPYPTNGWYQVRHDNGQLWERGLFAQGRKEGFWERWYADGQLSSQCTYRQGQMHGLHREWYENGLPAQECAFVDGRPHGVEKEWTHDGRLVFHATWVHGVRQYQQE